MFSSLLGSSTLDSSRSALSSGLRGSNLPDGVVPEVRNSSAEYASTCGLIFAQSMVQFKGSGCVIIPFSVDLLGFEAT